MRQGRRACTDDTSGCWGQGTTSLEGTRPSSKATCAHELHVTRLWKMVVGGKPATTDKARLNKAWSSRKATYAREWHATWLWSMVVGREEWEAALCWWLRHQQRPLVTTDNSGNDGDNGNHGKAATRHGKPYWFSGIFLASSWHLPRSEMPFKKTYGIFPYEKKHRRASRTKFSGNLRTIWDKSKLSKNP